MASQRGIVDIGREHPAGTTQTLNICIYISLSQKWSRHPYADILNVKNILQLMYF